MEDPQQDIHFQAPSLEELTPLFPTYELDAFIAQGGMGAVYKARQISLDRPVAIKILPREFGDDPQFRASFQAEAKAMARLNHPNLISVYDFGEVDGMLFLVMECVEGKSLYHSSYGRVVDPHQAAEIVIAISRGLDHAHKAGILHRDVKPANILLSPDATPKIGDFGLATPINQTASKEEVVYGTPGYTAPEVIHRLQVDRRADIFSTGVILHELLTGSIPDAVKTPPSATSGCPVAFDAIVAKCIHPNPESRYSTTAELAEDLEKAFTVTSTAPILNLPVAGTTHQPTYPGISAAPKKSTAARTATLVILSIAIVSTGAYLLTQETSPPPAPRALVTPVSAPKPIQKPVKKPVIEAPTPTPIITPTPKKENAYSALAKFKEKLASGARDEFPEGTLEHNGSHFLQVRYAVTWQTAQDFAENHGGHLAIAVSAADKKWLNQSFKTQQPLWLGAGITANEKWQWLDASTWAAEDKIIPSSEQHRVVAINPEGWLTAGKTDETFGFIIQWRNDGTNPCTLDTQLQRTAESVKEEGVDNARYPVGTQTYQQSHFLLIPRYSSWENAHQFAKSNQAELAVPSSSDESQWMASTFAVKSSYWLGGYLLKATDPWQWTTREPWHSSGWKSGEPNIDPTYNRLVMASSNSPQSWSSSQGSKGETTAILLEWSCPKRAATDKTFDLNKWTSSVNRKIKSSVEGDVERHTKERRNLIVQYAYAMNRYAKKVEGIDYGKRGWARKKLANQFRNVLEKTAEKVKKTEELPEFNSDRFTDRFTGDLRKIYNSVLKTHVETENSLRKIDTDYQTKLDAHLKFYTQGLLNKTIELEKAGYYPTANTLKKSINNLGGDTDKLIATLGLND